MKKLMRSLFVSLLTGLLLLCGTSCGKKVTKHPSRLIIKTMPEKAQVFILGEERGKKLRVPPGVYILKFTHPGYMDTWKKVEVPRGKTVEVSCEMQRETSDVMISTVPEKAQLNFRGRQLGLTPVVIRDLPHGEYTATVTMPGYSPQTAQWKVTSATPQLVRIKLDSNMGTLSVSSLPSGARIFLDGKAVGQTPYREKLAAGSYEMVLKRKDYADLTKQIVISRNRETKHPDLQMAILRGSITVESIPSGGKVFMDGKEYGTAPYTFRDLLPGQYTIRVEKEGFDGHESTIRLPAGARLRETVRLDTNRSGVDVITQPANLTLYLDGRMLGVSVPDPENKNFSKLFPIRNLSSGKHTLVVYHKRGRPQRKTYTFTTVKGRTLRLNNIRLWVPNARITYHSSSRATQEGRIVQVFPDGSVFFEPTQGIRTKIQKNLIRKIDYLEDMQ